MAADDNVPQEFRHHARPLLLNGLLAASEAIQRLERPETPSADARSPDLLIQIASAKAAAVSAGDQDEAKLCWQAEAIARAQLSFEDSFELMKNERFYEAWCELEQCEIIVASIKRHYTPSPDDLQRIGYIETMVARWQSIYPYAIFFSPEFLKKRVECSTCGAKVSLRNPCGHEKGEIYDGEQCYHRVVELKLLSISAVENPVQKYSVAFLSSEDGSGHRDHYDYSIVKFAVDRLISPYHGWHKEIQTRTVPIEALAHLLPSATCPCGSGTGFGECCASKQEVITPHLQFVFYVQPPEGLPPEQLNF
ncbi:SEC-C domain-containing protein [Oxalobacteraceae sp. CFBP 8753]|nr:SEC-C domain-containing protein [Oxalobacteraceae sp. CFBP 8753]